MSSDSIDAPGAAICVDIGTQFILYCFTHPDSDSGCTAVSKGRWKSGHATLPSKQTSCWYTVHAVQTMTPTEAARCHVCRFINWQAHAIRRTDPSALVTAGSWSQKSQTDMWHNKNIYADRCLVMAGGREQVLFTCCSLVSSAYYFFLFVFPVVYLVVFGLFYCSHIWAWLICTIP